MSCVFVSIRTVIYQDLKKSVIELLVLVVLVSTREDPKITNEMRNEKLRIFLLLFTQSFFYFIFVLFSFLFNFNEEKIFRKDYIKNKTNILYAWYTCVGYISIQFTDDKTNKNIKINNNWLKILLLFYFFVVLLFY